MVIFFFGFYKDKESYKPSVEKLSALRLNKKFSFKKIKTNRG